MHWVLEIKGIGYFSTVLPDGSPLTLELAERYAWTIWAVAKAWEADRDGGRARQGWRTKQEIATAIYKAGRLKPNTETVTRYMSTLKSELADHLARAAPGVWFPSLFEVRPRQGARLAKGITIEIIEARPDDPS